MDIREVVPTTGGGLARLDLAAGRALSATKSSLLVDHGVKQLGAFAWPIPEPVTWPDVEPADGDALIESFLLDADAGVSAVGEPDVAAPWVDVAEQVGGRFAQAMAHAQIDVVWPAWLTCSVTPVSMLEGSVHLDDDQIDLDAGLGVVAVFGEHVGPRAARGFATHEHASPLGPLDVERLDLASTDWQRAGADELCVFAQFGQAHAGPSATEIAAVTDATTRRLVVIRAATERFDRAS